MARVHPNLQAFNRGEISKSALARVDIEKLRLAAESQVNWAPTATGSMMLRPGTQYLFSTRSDAACLGIPFIYGTNDTAILELTDSHLRVIVSDALLTRASVSTTVTNGDMSSSTGWTLAGSSNITTGTVTVASPCVVTYPAAHGLEVGDEIVFYNNGDTLPNELSFNTPVYVQAVPSSTTVNLSLTYGGAVLNTTGTSSGTHMVKANIADINTTTSGALHLRAIARGTTVSALRDVTVAGGDQATLHAFVIVVTKGPVTFMCGTTSGGADLIARQSLGTGRHSLTCTPGTGTIYVKFESEAERDVIVDSIQIEGSGTFDMAAPWAAADLSKIRYHQSGDIVFIACDGYQQRKIERRANNSWSLVVYESDDGPFVTSGTQSISLTTSVYEGNGTLTASGPLFQTSDTGKMFRIFSGGQTYRARLGAAGAVSGAIRVSGISNTDRGFSWVVAGTWVGTIALERSVEGPDSGFKEHSTTTINTTGTAINDSADYDNVTVWYRIRWKTYTSGTAIVSFITTTGGGGIFGTGPTNAAASSGETALVRVTSVTSATVVNIEVLSPFSTRSASTAWDHGDWSTYSGWPTEVRFFGGRLFWFRGDKYWGSEPDAYYSFDSTVEGDAGPINRTFGAGPVDKINFALDLTRLVVGREGSIDTVRSSSQDDPLTPTNTTSRTVSTKGADALPACKVGLRGVYVDKSQRRVYGLAYSVENGDYVSQDLTALNLDIGKQTFTAPAVQEQPDTYLHFPTGYGQDAVLLYDPGDELLCWWRIQTLGVIERVVVLPGSIEDSVYYVVKRTINSSTKRFWEKTALRSACEGGSLNKNADCFLSVSQASSTTVSGLSHLEGASVVLWANGKDLGTYTVSAGAITASEAVTTGIVGLGGVSYSYDSSSASATLTCSSAYNGYPIEVYANGPHGGKLRYVGVLQVSGGVATLPNGRTAKKIIGYMGFYAPYRSAKLAYGAQMGTALLQNKKVEKVGLLAYNTHYQGLQYGSEIDNLQPMPLSISGQDITADTVFDEHDEAMVGLSGSWTTDSRLHLLAQAPKPVTLGGVVISMSVNESR
jgi:hypothetical protein